MIEHLLDEALVWALRRRATGSSWADIQQAKMTEEIGLAQPVEYAEAERRTIATHESGHATVAWLVGKGRKLEVLSIIKRKDALGLLAALRGGGALHRRPAPRSRPSSRSPSAAWWPRRSSSARRARGWPRPPGRHHRGLPDGREPGHGEHPDLRRRARHAGGNIVAKVTSADAGRDEVEDAAAPGQGRRPRRCSRTNRHVIEALRDALLDRDELVGVEILDVIAVGRLRRSRGPGLSSRRRTGG